MLDLSGHGSGTPLEAEEDAGWDVPVPREVTSMDTNQLGSTVRDVEERVEAQVKEATRRAQSAAERVLTLARENPGLSLAAAFGLGYLIARIARRS
jgi:hypothetical protein